MVPAPRLELGTDSENICAFRCILSAALEEIERGQTRPAKAILNTLKEVLSNVSINDITIVATQSATLVFNNSINGEP